MCTVVQNREDIEQLLLQRIVALCQDTDYQVRVAMCAQLPAVALGVGRESTQKQLLDEIFELVQDEEMQVRSAGCLAAGSHHCSGCQHCPASQHLLRTGFRDLSGGAAAAAPAAETLAGTHVFTSTFGVCCDCTAVLPVHSGQHMASVASSTCCDANQDAQT
jgi:hypothetical protein